MRYIVHRFNDEHILALVFEFGIKFSTSAVTLNLCVYAKLHCTI